MLFKPFDFFVLPGLILLIFAIYTNTWMFIHFFDAFAVLPPDMAWNFTEAFAVAFKEHPHTFIFGLLSLMLSIQMMSLGVISLQSKKYYEDLYHLGTTIMKNQIEVKEEKKP